MAKLKGGRGPGRDEGGPAEDGPRGKDDPETARLVTPLHFPAWNPGPPSIQSLFRVVSVSRDGLVALVTMARSRREALNRVRALDAEATREVVEFRAQEWVGSAFEGSWEDVRR